MNFHLYSAVRKIYRPYDSELDERHLALLKALGFYLRPLDVHYQPVAKDDPACFCLEIVRPELPLVLGRLEALGALINDLDCSVVLAAKPDIPGEFLLTIYNGYLE